MNTNKLWSIMMVLILVFGNTFILLSCGGDDDEDMNVNDKNENSDISHVEKVYCPDVNHPHAIDLGLPSGIKWACCNVGASDPLQEGDYFAWGEIESKEDYFEDTYKYAYYNKNKGYLPYKYYFLYDDKFGWLDDKLELLEPEDDVAYRKWGKGWRMPTIEEYEELNRYCSICFEIDKYGYHLIGKNSKELYVPKAGYYDGNMMKIGLSSCYYWSKSLYGLNCWYAYCAVFDNYVMIRIITDANAQRSLGLTVRPVYDAKLLKKEYENK